MQDLHLIINDMPNPFRRNNPGHELPAVIRDPLGAGLDEVFPGIKENETCWSPNSELPTAADLLSINDEEAEALKNSDDNETAERSRILGRLTTRLVQIKDRILLGPDLDPFVPSAPGRPPSGDWRRAKVKLPPWITDPMGKGEDERFGLLPGLKPAWVPGGRKVSLRGIEDLTPEQIYFWSKGKVRVAPREGED